MQIRTWGVGESLPGYHVQKLDIFRWCHSRGSGDGRDPPITRGTGGFRGLTAGMPRGNLQSVNNTGDGEDSDARENGLLGICGVARGRRPKGEVLYDPSWPKQALVEGERADGHDTVICSGPQVCCERCRPQRDDTLISWDVKSGYRRFSLHPDIWNFFVFRYRGKCYRCIALSVEQARAIFNPAARTTSRGEAGLPGPALHRRLFGGSLPVPPATDDT